jgi:hypothetical protein
MGVRAIERCFVSNQRDPRVRPAAGDMLRREIDGHHTKMLIVEVIAVDRYGIKYKANGTMQSSVDLTEWKKWAAEAEVTHIGNSDEHT